MKNKYKCFRIDYSENIRGEILLYTSKRKKRNKGVEWLEDPINNNPPIFNMAERISDLKRQFPEIYHSEPPRSKKERKMWRKVKKSEEKFKKNIFTY